MGAYHGTTRTRARKIFGQGFLPKPPSHRVWFAENRRIAMGRAKRQARRTDDVPMVLACDLDLDKLRGQLGAKRVFHRKEIISVRGPVPVGMLRSDVADLGTVPQEVAAWVNSLLGLEPRESVRPDHPDLVRRVRRAVAARPRR